MTTQADQKDTTRRSRRQLPAGGTSVPAAVLAAEAIARPAPAYAGTDGDAVLGAPNNASSQTTVKMHNRRRCRAGGRRRRERHWPGRLQRQRFWPLGSERLGRGPTRTVRHGRRELPRAPERRARGDRQRCNSGVWGENVGNPGGHGVVGTTNGPLPAVLGEQSGSGRGDVPGLPGLHRPARHGTMRSACRSGVPVHAQLSDEFSPALPLSGSRR
jgi:hypothetical protein